MQCGKCTFRQGFDAITHTNSCTTNENMHPRTLIKWQIAKLKYQMGENEKNLLIFANNKLVF